MIYSLRAQPKADESHIQEVPKHNGLIFRMGKVSELWRKPMVNNSHAFNLSNCLVVIKN